MAATKTRPKKESNSKSASATVPRDWDVLTLAEAAAYLRIGESEVLLVIQEQGLPGRKIADEWRFLKSALQDWLRSYPFPPDKKDFWETQIGAFKDDPSLEEMLQKIYQQRGRPMTEED